MFLHSTVFFCLVATVFGGAYEDEVLRKQNIVQAFWANNVNVSLPNFQRSIFALNPYVVPIAFNNGVPFAVYLETEKGKVLVLPKLILDKLVAKVSYPLYTQWLSIMFNGKVGNLTTDTSARDGRGIVVTPATTKFDYEAFYNDWVAGKTGPVFVESGYDVLDGPNCQLAQIMGIYLEGAAVSMRNPIMNLTYTPEGKLEPANMPLLSYMEDINNTLVNPLQYNPQDGTGIAYVASKCKVSVGIVLNFLKKYINLLQQNIPTPAKPHSIENAQFPRGVLNTLNDLIFSLSLSQVAQQELDSIKLNAGYVGGLKIDGSGTMPKMGNYEVTIDPKWVNYISTGLYHVPNTVYEYEIEESSWNPTLYLQTNQLSDNLSGKSLIRRLAMANSYVHARERTGRFYSPTGGPIFIQDRSRLGKKITIKFRNVTPTPGVDVRVNATFDRWNTGIFKNSSLRWSTIFCDSIWFAMELDKIKDLSDQSLRDFCTTYDTMVKGMINFSGYPATDRMGFVYDTQPSVGAAHSGNPIVAGDSWQSAMLSTFPKFIKHEPASYWGALHEIGHNLQQNKWTFSGFTEITNNVMVLYAQEIFANTSAPPYTNAVYRNNQAVAYFILGQPGAISPTFGYLHYYTVLKFDFGWSLIGNVFNLYKTENNTNRTIEQWVKYMTAQTGMNMVPYHFFFNFGEYFTNINATYREYAHLPVYQPTGEIFDLAIQKWQTAKAIFNFTEDRSPSGKLMYQFDQFNGIGNISDPSPSVREL